MPKVKESTGASLRTVVQFEINEEAVIRPANEKDYKEIYELSSYLFNHCSSLNPDLFSGNLEVDIENCFVLISNKEIIGFFEFHKKENAIIVDSFAIKENYQNLKYGERLFKYLEKYAEKADYNFIKLSTLNEIKTINFYKKMGMKIDIWHLTKELKSENYKPLAIERNAEGIVLRYNDEIMGNYKGYGIGHFDDNDGPVTDRYIIDSFSVKKEYKKYKKELFQIMENYAMREQCKKMMMKETKEDKVNFYKKMGMGISYCDLIKPVGKSGMFEQN